MTEEQENNVTNEEDQELFEHYNFVVDPGQQPLRIDKFLLNRIENTSRTKIQNAAKAGSIRVNSSEVKQNYRVRPGDEISIVLSFPPRVVEIHPENIPIEILYEDDHLLLVNKATNMVVHPGFNNYTGTLLNALTYHIKQAHPEKEDYECIPYLAHRIDKDTTGILVVAKTEITESNLARQFYDHSIERKYNALVWGDTPDEGSITGNLARSLKDRRVMQVYEDETIGRHAVTHYKTIQRFGYISLVECQLETGRTHQIRAHFKHIGHPVFGDKTYGGDKIIKGTTFTKYKQFIENCFKILPRQALHAKSLGFKHPNTGKDVFFETDLPEDMMKVMEKWKVYTTANS